MIFVRVLVLATAVAVSTGVAAVDARVSGEAAERCPAVSASPGSGDTVATITDVLHSSVYVDTKFVGTVPFAVAGSSRICTDQRGQAIFDLVPSDKTAACIMLPSSALQVPPAGSTTSLDFEGGSAWCALRRGDAVIGASSKRVRRVSAATTTAVVGVVVSSRTTTLKVWSGAAFVDGRTRVVVKASQQVTISARGTPGPVTASVVGAVDKIAIAKLRLAQPKR